MSQHNWDKRFLELVHVVATWSKDPNTQVGSAVVNRNHRVVSLGFNGIPTGVDDQRTSRFIKPAKYYFFEHAERNAIFNAVGQSELSGCVLYTTHVPCADCARGIIQTGISSVKIPAKFPFLNNYLQSNIAVIEMFYEAGVDAVLVGDHINYKIYPIIHSF